MKSSSLDTERRRRFDEVVGVFHKDIYRYAAWLSRDPGVAEVVVQETMLRAWKSLDSLQEDSAARQWLLTIARRENARYFERKPPETMDIDELTPGQAAMVAHTDDPTLEDLRKMIFRLQDEYREPLVLQVLMGYSTREIAELMGIKPGAVLTRLHRARLKLKNSIDEGAAA